MFSIFKYIAQTICSINNYIFLPVNKFFKLTTIDKATETLESIKEAKNNQIIEGFHAVHQQLLNMQPKLDYMAAYIDSICVKKRKPAPGAKKKLQEYLIELLDKHDDVGEKFDLTTSLFENSKAVAEVLNVITTL